MDTLQGNKLIAEFMGFEKVPDSYSSFYAIPQEWINSIGESSSDRFLLAEMVFVNGDLFRCFDINKAGFHWLWNWLMPVVDKIEHTLTVNLQGKQSTVSFQIERNGCVFRFGYSETGFDFIKPYKIDATWCAVVAFIEWHNSQTHK